MLGKTKPPEISEATLRVQAEIEAMSREVPSNYEAHRQYHKRMCDLVRKHLVEIGRTGPWTLTEGDYTFVRTEGAPWIGIVYRNPITFALCGYIGLPAGHKYWGKQYEEVEEAVHGGFTYADADRALIQSPKEPNYWWLGFDCAHHGDYMPMMPVGANERQYKTEVWVRNQIIKIAKELFTGNWKAATFTDMLKDL